MTRLVALSLVSVLSECTEEDLPYGPDNAWHHVTESQIPLEYVDGSVGTGTAVGDVVANFTFKDQNGDDVELYQFYGQVVQLVLFAQWCGPCQQEAPTLEAASRALAPEGAVMLEVMLQASDGPSSVDAANEWVDAYGITHPILADVQEQTSVMLQGGFPTLPLLDRELRIVTLDNWEFSEAVVRDLAVSTAVDAEAP